MGRRKDSYLQVFRRHGLFLMHDSPDYKVFMLKEIERKTRMCSTQIVFTPEGIGISGDMCPGRHGVHSAYGYGLYWFRGQLSEQYLAEKFLTRDWHHELARNTLRSMVDRDSAEWSDEARVAVEDVIYLLDGRDISQHEMYEALEDAGFEDMAEYDIGWGYDPRDRALLSAIQMRFAELYHKDLRRP